MRRAVHPRASGPSGLGGVLSGAGRDARVPHSAGRGVALAARASAVLGVLLVTTGCILLDLVGSVVSLLFDAVTSVGEGVASVVGSVVVADPIDGPPPRVTALADGSWRVDPSPEPSRFRVTLSAPGHESRTWTWPDDFDDVRPGADGVAHVECLLAAAPVSRPR